MLIVSPQPSARPPASWTIPTPLFHVKPSRHDFPVGDVPPQCCARRSESIEGTSSALLPIRWPRTRDQKGSAHAQDGYYERRSSALSRGVSNTARSCPASDSG